MVLVSQVYLWLIKFKFAKVVTCVSGKSIETLLKLSTMLCKYVEWFLLRAGNLDLFRYCLQ